MRPDLVETCCGSVEVAISRSTLDRHTVFLHHGFGTWHSLTDLAERMAQTGAGCRNVFYSRPGCGGSPPRPNRVASDYLRDEAQHVLPALLDALEIEQADFVGHSDGGTIALLFAAAAPERARRVVAIAPHVFSEQVTIKGVRDFDTRTDDSNWRKYLARRHRDPATAYDYWRNFWLSERGAEWSVTDELSTCRAPLLLIQGEHDAFGSYAQLDAITERVTGPNRQIRLPGIGHEPHREEPEIVGRLVAEFLDETTSPEA